MDKIFIFHFRPLEHYPPILNLLSFFEGKHLIRCFSTIGKLDYALFDKGIRVNRLGKLNNNKITIWLTYISYNFLSFLALLIFRPKRIIYVETLSALPAIIYKKYVNDRVKVYIHYHEYTSPEEYAKSSPVERFIHRFEKTIYKKVDWISHTNSTRMQKFLNDENLILEKELHHIMPNYPSRKWSISNRKWEKNEPLKLVFVGYSLTEKGSYLKELIECLSHLEFKSELNIYCIEHNAFVKKMEGLNGNLHLNLHQAVNYKEVPKVLSQHHVGVILYKASTPNFIYNAPNKLFEYLSCGLEVWFPEEMKGIHPYQRSNYPRVIKLDFDNLSLATIINGIPQRRLGVAENIDYYAENVYEKFRRFINA